MMELFAVPKIGLFLDTITHGTETRRGDEVKVVTLTLRVPQLSAQLASAMPGPVRLALFRSTEGAIPRAGLRRVEFALGAPRQALSVFASSDTTDASIAFDQAKVTATIARVEKDAAHWTLVVKVSFGPLDKTELEYIEGWRLTQRWVTFIEAEPGMFEDDEDAPADEGDADEPLPFTRH